jgi:signal transduction histidine kinase
MRATPGQLARSHHFRLVCSLLIGALGLGVSVLLHEQFGYGNFGIIIAGLLVAAWLGGLSGGFFAALLCVISFELVIMHSVNGLGAEPAAIDVATLVVSTVVVILLTAKLRKASDDARFLYRALTMELEKRTGFWGGAAHDLKHPLAAINLRAQLMQRKLGPGLNPQEIASGLDEIRGSAHEMSELIEEMQDAAQMQTGMSLDLTPEDTNLVALASDLAAQICSRTGRAIRVEAEADELSGYWDPARLRRVLGNLVSNALKYSPPDSEIRVMIDREGGWARVRVQDDGIGIPQGELRFVFDQFYRGTNVRRKVYGTGLGLAGSRSIVEQHGGTIDAESTEGAGSTFTVRLPLSDLPASPAREMDRERDQHLSLS